MVAAPRIAGEIRSQDGYRYTLHGDDLLWLGRAVEFEGGDAAATVWTYAQRMATPAGRGRTLTAMVRAHSQPLNPLWQSADTAKCRQYPESCTPAHIERRRRARTASWESLSEETRRTVIEWASAMLPNPVPGATDFANHRVTAGFVRRHPGSKVVLKTSPVPPSQWYVVPSTSDRAGGRAAISGLPALEWPDTFVTMHYQGRTAGATNIAIRLWRQWWPWVGGAGVVAVLGALLLWWRS